MPDIALVTGASSGIGLALAQQLATQGVQVVLVARQSSRLDEALSNLSEPARGQHVAIPTDVRDPQQVASMAEQVIRKIGVPDLLINNAGVAHPGYVQALDIDIFHWMMEVNYYGALYVTKAFLPGLIARRSGHIVNVVSTAGFVGIFGYSAYSASKFALRGFSDSLRVEMKSLGIQVSLVCPSDTDTPQYAYEHPLRPVELEGMFSAIGMKPIPAEIVASRILNGIAKKKPVIIPDAETGALFFLINHFGNLAYPIQDLLLAYSRKKAGGKRYQSASSENQPE